PRRPDDPRRPERRGTPALPLPRPRDARDDRAEGRSGTDRGARNLRAPGVVPLAHRPPDRAGGLPESSRGALRVGVGLSHLPAQCARDHRMPPRLEWWAHAEWRKEPAMIPLPRPFRPVDLTTAALESFDLKGLAQQLTMEPQYEEEGKA